MKGGKDMEPILLSDDEKAKLKTLGGLWIGALRAELTAIREQTERAKLLCAAMTEICPPIRNQTVTITIPNCHLCVFLSEQDGEWHATYG